MGFLRRKKSTDQIEETTRRQQAQQKEIANLAWKIEDVINECLKTIARAENVENGHIVTAREKEALASIKETTEAYLAQLTDTPIAWCALRFASKFSIDARISDAESNSHSSKYNRYNRRVTFQTEQNKLNEEKAKELKIAREIILDDLDKHIDSNLHDCQALLSVVEDHRDTVIEICQPIITVDDEEREKAEEELRDAERQAIREKYSL